MSSNWSGDQSGWFSDSSTGGAQNYGSYPNAGTTTAPGYNDYYDNAGYVPPGDTGGFYGGSRQIYEGGVFYPDTAGDVVGESVSFDDEPPLLEELGINFDHIRQKTMAVLNPLGKADASVISDQDLAGPLVFCLLFGGALLLHGKMHFGYIYGIGVLGCLGMYALLNLMAVGGISVTCTVSILGYCLLPMGLLSLVTAILSFK